MSREWKPGDVVSAYVPSRMSREVAVYRGGKKYPWRLLTSIFGNGGFDEIGPDNVEDVRPLVVIDPEDRAQVEALVKSAWPAAYHQSEMTSNLQRALLEFANPTPPRPDEPLGLGAAVECDPGPVYDRAWAVRLWANDDFGGKPWSWFDSSGNGGPRHWNDLPVTRVLSEGVTP